MEMLKKILGVLWALPVTLVGALYVLPCWALGWYKFAGLHDTALLWVLTEKTPKWLRKLWTGWAGQTIGNLVVMAQSPETELRWQKILVHEQQHVKQCMVLGVFQPILYGACFLSAKLLKVGDAYRDNPFEVDARRTADAWLTSQK